MDTKQKIIKVAGRMFAEHGFDGVSVRDVVRAAKVNLGAITYHFGGKEQLYEAVIQEKAMPLRDGSMRIVGSDLSPREKLSEILRGFAMQVLHVDPTIRLLFAESMRRRRHAPKSVIEAHKKRDQLVGDIIRQGVADGSFRQCNVVHSTRVFFGLLSFYMMHPANKRAEGRGGAAYPKRQVNEIVDNALDIFFGGLAKDGKGKKRGRGKKV